MTARTTMPAVPGNLGANLVVPLLVAVATLVGFWIRIYRLEWLSPWLDEWTTVLYAAEPWSRLLGDLATVDVHPPYYYAVQKAWGQAFGSDVSTLRLLPVVLGTSCIPLLFVLGRRLLGSRAGVIAALLLTTAPLHVFQSRELRMYSLLNVSVLIALIGLAYALPEWRNAAEWRPTRSRVPSWAAYVLGSTSAFYAQSTGIFMPVLAGAVLASMWFSGKVSRRIVLEFAVASALILLAVLPWIGILVTHVRDTLMQFWIPKPTLGWVKSQLMGAYPYHWTLKPVVLGTALWGLWAIRNRASAIFIGTFVVGQPIVMWLVSYARPILIVRALVWPTMLFLLLPAAIIATFSPPLMVAATSIIIAVQSSAVAKYPQAKTETDAEKMKSRFVGFDSKQDVLVLGYQRMETELRPAVPLIFEGRAVAMVHGDKRELIEPLFKAKRVLRSDLSNAVAGARRAWIVSEIEPKFPVPPADDVVDAVRKVRESGRELARWSTGNMSLTLVELPIK